MKKLICAFFAVLMLLSFTGCGNKTEGRSVASADDLVGANVGVLSGADASGLGGVFEAIGAEMAEYNSVEALSADLKNGRIDCIVIDEGIGKKIVGKTAGIKVLEQPFLYEKYSIAIAKENIDLTEDVNEALLYLEENEILEKIVSGYVNGTGYKYESTLDRENINGTLTLAVAPDNSPYAYKDAEGNYVGIDIDVARAVCDRLNIDFTVREEKASELMISVQSGRSDFALGRIVETEENLEIVDFSSDYMESTQVMIVRKK